MQMTAPVDPFVAHLLGPPDGAFAFPCADFDDELGFTGVEDLLHDRCAAAALEVKGLGGEVEALEGIDFVKELANRLCELRHCYAALRSNPVRPAQRSLR